MIRAIMIVEIAGRPAEHVKAALSKHIEVLDKVDDITVHSIKISEPRKIENSNEMFTCFAEADFEAKSFARLSETMFDFMPSSVEVIEPSKVTLSMGEATDLLNNISGRMHRYDEIAKIAGERLRQMGVQLKAAQEELVSRSEVSRGDRKQVIGDRKGKAVKKKVIKKGKKRVKKK